MTNTLEQLKQTVKKHNIVPFSARDISCQGRDLIVDGRYKAMRPRKILETLGIRDNLIKEIYEKPDVNWSPIRDALNTIDPNKRFGAIVNAESNDLLTLASAVKEETQLNYDNRLDSLFNAIDDSGAHALQNAFWNPLDCQVSISAINNSSEIECGGGDNWKFGTSIIIGDNMNQFANYFLRLVCTNGMTTRDNIAYRMASANSNIAKQFAKFSSSEAFASTIKPRVDRLRNNRASLYEFMSVADCLDKDSRDAFMPEYAQVCTSFANAGYPIDEFSAARKKFVYTNENLYDVFNLATNLASHQRSVIGDGAALSLNKVAAEIFSKGPNLDFQILDIYKN